MRSFSGNIGATVIAQLRNKFVYVFKEFWDKRFGGFFMVNILYESMRGATSTSILNDKLMPLWNVNILNKIWNEALVDPHRIESIKTTSMEDVSPRVLEKK